MRRGATRVEISGGIASGKTTLATLLRDAGLIPIYENFRKNPFFLAFYRDPIGTALETEVTFLLQHYHQQKLAAARMRSYTADFSLVLDHAYANVTLSARDVRLFRKVLQRVEEELPRRTLLIRLSCPPEVELTRIRARRRHAERAITIDYLEKINVALKTQVGKLPSSENVLVIDSETTNFAHKQDARIDVLHQVTKALRDI